MLHTFDGTGLIILCSCLRVKVCECFICMNIRTTENYKFAKIRTAEVTGNPTNNKNSQGDIPICSTRDEMSQPSQLISPRAATG